MWYSWKGVDEGDAPAQPISHNRSTSLLDRRQLPDENALCKELTQGAEFISLWKTFLTNVHPIVKIFFDWEIEPFVQKAAQKSPSLPKGHRALMFAIQFIAALSLDDGECMLLFGDHKPQVLNKFQMDLEDALVLAEYTSTKQKSTLQALIIYCVCHRLLAQND